ncbi:Protein CBG14787 [Caenorhabditis briggsae]|uniref:Protein CBG14787 n=1 Tax=Caenorhabditis briggsae TaxID=6238 RepID=A8XKN9_CAEBR|nr:Protein CBG14787 [Caenorhabditis briggsae]CAP33213.1 Protein CBG14787 [Caenorhabditis briggsae]
METINTPGNVVQQDTHIIAFRKFLKQWYNWYVVNAVEAGFVTSHLMFIATIRMQCPYMREQNIFAACFVIYNIAMAWILKKMKRDFGVLVHLFGTIFCGLVFIEFFTTMMCPLEDCYSHVKERAADVSVYGQLQSLIWGVGVQVFFGYILSEHVLSFCATFRQLMLNTPEGAQPIATNAE